MVATALDALVGGEPDEEIVAGALTTIPAGEVPGALRALAKTHGPAALPVLRGALAGRPAWAAAAAAALGTLPRPDVAEALAAAARTATDKQVRTAARRALYRLRQAGVVPAAPAAARPVPARPRPARAWLSAVDGTGSRGLWLLLEGPLGEHVLCSAVLNDEVGLLDFAGEPIAKKRLEERRRALATESPLPWVEAPPAWAHHLLVEARSRHQDTGAPIPHDAARWLDALGPPPAALAPPIQARVTATALADPTLLEQSAEVLALPEQASWFLDPPGVQTEALELLQTQESRLVVSDQIKAERVAALVDRVIEAQLTPEARRRWQRRLEENAFVLAETGRPLDAGRALAAAQALADPERVTRHIPFVRALVERSLELAGEVTLGRLSADEASRRPRRPGGGPLR